MPKKKPIDKRLNKLFDDINQVEPSAKAKPRDQKLSTTEQAQPVPQVQPASKRARANETQPANATQTDTAFSRASDN